MAKIQQVKELLARGMKPEDIALRVGLTAQRVREYRSKLAKPDYYKAAERAYRRDVLGHRPQAEVSAEHRERNARRLKTIDQMIATGLSWRQAAEKLGITVNVIAGLKHKQRHRRMLTAS